MTGDDKSDKSGKSDSKLDAVSKKGAKDAEKGVGKYLKDAGKDIKAGGKSDKSTKRSINDDGPSKSDSSNKPAQHDDKTQDLKKFIDGASHALFGTAKSGKSEEYVFKPDSKSDSFSNFKTPSKSDTSSKSSDKSDKLDAAKRPTRTIRRLLTSRASPSKSDISNKSGT